MQVEWYSATLPPFRETPDLSLSSFLFLSLSLSLPFLSHHITHSELQEGLIRSHAVGVGSPLSPEQTRRLLALRINVLAKGFR